MEAKKVRGKRVEAKEEMFSLKPKAKRSSNLHLVAKGKRLEAAGWRL